MSFSMMEYYDRRDELELAGLDLDELEWMDPEERREALELAGLDPDDFDDDYGYVGNKGRQGERKPEFEREETSAVSKPAVEERIREVKERIEELKTQIQEIEKEPLPWSEHIGMSIIFFIVGGYFTTAAIILTILGGSKPVMLLSYFLGIPILLSAFFGLSLIPEDKKKAQKDKELRLDDIRHELVIRIREYNKLNRENNTSSVKSGEQTCTENAVSGAMGNTAQSSSGNGKECIAQGSDEKTAKASGSKRHFLIMIAIVAVLIAVVIGYLMHDKKMKEAAALQEEISDEEAPAAVDDEEVSEAAEAESEEDSEVSEETKIKYYKEGKKLLKDKKYQKAYIAFSKAEDYSDSKSMASRCVEKLIGRLSKSTMYGFWKVKDGVLSKAQDGSVAPSTVYDLEFVNGDMLGTTLGVIDSSGNCSIINTSYTKDEIFVDEEKNVFENVNFVAVTGDSGKWVKAIGVKKDGSLVYKSGTDLSAINYWINMRTVSVYGRYIAGLDKYGSVWLYDFFDKEEYWVKWKDIVQVRVATNGMTDKLYGLSADGTLNIMSINSSYPYATSDLGKLKKFAVFDAKCVIGLKSDGTLVSRETLPKKLRKLKNISDITADDRYITVKLKNGEYKTFRVYERNGKYKLGDSSGTGSIAITPYEYTGGGSHSGSSSNSTNNGDGAYNDGYNDVWDDDDYDDDRYRDDRDYANGVEDALNEYDEEYGEEWEEGTE